MRPSSKHAVAGALAAGALFLALSPAHSQEPRVVRRDVQPLQTSNGGCADAVRDQADATNCIPASSVPALGSLYPLSQDFFVRSGRVGIGTTFPFRTLEVVGSVAVSRPEGLTKVVLRPSFDDEFGIVETITRNPGGIPSVTNLLSTVSTDPLSGAMATFRGDDLLAALTTPANNSDAGYLTVRNANVETAGINGGTGIVFGSAKAFVQPHPTDSTKEIQYISLEGTEHGVYVRGSAQLSRGEALIELPESFRLVTREEGLTVSLTPLGPNRGLYVESKSLAGIVVRENEGGAGDVFFDFLVLGERAAMPQHVAIQENTHFAPEPGTTVPEGALPGAYRELLIRNGTLNDDGSVNEVSAAGLGWHVEKGTWTGGKRASAEPAKD